MRKGDGKQSKEVNHQLRKKREINWTECAPGKCFLLLVSPSGILNISHNENEIET